MDRIFRSVSSNCVGEDGSKGTKLETDPSLRQGGSAGTVQRKFNNGLNQGSGGWIEGRRENEEVFWGLKGQDLGDVS